MIAEWRICVDCGRRFGLTPRQCGPGMRRTDRCGRDRVIRRRQTKTAWMRQNRRLTASGPKSAPIHAPTGPAARV